MTLRGADLRFVLPHAVRRARVLGDGRHPQMTAVAAGLRDAGVDIVPAASRSAERPDVVVAPSADATQALGVPGRAHLLLGRLPGGLPRRAAAPMLVRGAPAAPALVLPLRSGSALRHYLRRMSAPRGVLARGRNAGLSALGRHPLAPRVLPPLLAGVTLVPPPGEPHRPPAVLRAAEELGVRPGEGWVLSLAPGDVLKRAVFAVLGQDDPRWVVKFGRVAGYDRSFRGDAAGLALARTAGGPVAAHAPAHLGLLDVDGLTASVETAAAGRKMIHLLRRSPWPLVEAVAGWTREVGTRTARPAAALEAERARLRQVVAAAGVPLGVPADLVDQVPPVPAVLQHNDLGTWNIVADGTAFTALDWESARESGLPLWDLFYFAADVLARIDGPADADALVGRAVRVFAGESPHSDRLFGWVRAAAADLAIPGPALGPLATLCWLHHGQSPGRRTADLGGGSAAPLGHHPRLAAAWAAHPGLGTSWPALTGAAR